MRGEVYRYRPGSDTQGHEQRGTRYCIVVQADHLEQLSTWLVVPTSTSARPATFRPEITVNGATTLAMCEQVRALDPSKRLGERVGLLTLPQLQAVEAALRLVQDL